MAEISCAEWATEVGVALNGLNEPSRTCLLLAYKQGLTHQAIAARTGIARNLVSTAIAKGMRIWRRYLISRPRSYEVQMCATGSG